jgi:hypothetical protein
VGWQCRKEEVQTISNLVGGHEAEAETTKIGAMRPQC